jgi:predicted O-linked N-acetylglucosamine transferase (SPINDLY family)
MAKISEALAIAIRHHQGGQLQAAEQIYWQILQAEPNHADAIHLLGVLAHQVGKHGIAVEYIKRAIGLKGNAFAFHNNLGEVYFALGRLPEAVACYRRALKLKPDYAEAHSNLGNAWKHQGKLDEAVACYRRALNLKPDFAQAHNNLGVACKDQKRLDEAVACYRRALKLKPEYAEAHNNLGNVLQDQGKLDEAVACYRRAVELKPDFAEAHSNLGTAWKDQAKLDEAVACYRRALELKPDYAEAHSNLGNAWKDQGKLDEAVACYRRAVELKPDFAQAHYNLGVVFKDQERLDEAVARFRAALELKPDFAEAHSNLGNAWKDQGKLDEAVACYRRALELKPDYADVHSNLGNAWKEQGKLDEAVACYRLALELKPEYAQVHYNLGVALEDQELLDEAVACYRRALKLKPDYAEAHNNLGVVFKDQELLHEAVACYRRALELKPDYAEAHYNLGNAWKDQGKLDEAIACFRRALELKPEYAKAHNNLGNAWKDQGELDEAVACYRQAVKLKPDYAEAHSNLLLTLQYCAGVTPAALAEAHAEYDRQHAASLRGAIAQHANVHVRDGPLRLGFVSPDLKRHPVGYFLVRVLENLDQTQQQTICYSDGSVKDALTHRLQAAATQWRDVKRMSDQRLAEQIRADQIDILFDLAGHTAHNRLLVFARKPAPIQISWMGYVGTTGLTAMDYILADRYQVPPETERHYCERILRMPHAYICYDPPAYAPPVAPLPALAAGRVTFGSFNNQAKLTPPVIRLWAKILQRLPDSRLVLKYPGMCDRCVAVRLTERFAGEGIEPDRVEFLDASQHADLLEHYNRIDIGLDPFPYSGGLTTCEALWMGVPVITCPGETFAGRHALSHLSNVGLTETIAHDLDEYMELAVSLAGDLQRLADLRAGLRQRMAASPLCDGKRFATELMARLHDVWEQWIA